MKRKTVITLMELELLPLVQYTVALTMVPEVLVAKQGMASLQMML